MLILCVINWFSALLLYLKKLCNHLFTNIFKIKYSFPRQFFLFFTQPPSCFKLFQIVSNCFTPFLAHFFKIRKRPAIFPFLHPSHPFFISLHLVTSRFILRSPLFQSQLFSYLCSTKSPKTMTLLDSFDAIKLLRISRSSLYRLIKHGVLHPMRFPHSRKIYFSREEIERALSLKTHITNRKN